MRAPFQSLTLLALAAGASLWTLGCAEGPVKTDPERLAALRERFVLEVEPADAMTPLDWRASQAASEEPADGPLDVLATVDPAEETAAEGPTPDPDRVVLKGYVGGMPNPWGADVEADFPWKQGQATFFLVDPPTADEFTSHAEDAGDDHAADCPFCAREAANKANAVATITFHGEDGEPIGIDSREVFGLTAGQLVVVRGAWSLVGDLLVVDADGIYLDE